MANYVKALIGEKGDFLTIITDSASAVREVEKIHKSSPVATCAMGRLLTAAKLMELSVKDEGARINVDIFGGGEAGRIVAYADKMGHLKCKIGNPGVETHITEAGKIDVGRAVGSDGYVTVTRDSYNAMPFSGSSKLVSGEIAIDIANYYVASEQQAAAISLGVFVSEDGSVEAAGGLMLHVLPDADDLELTVVEEMLSEMKTISTYLRETSDLEEILKRIFGDMKIAVIERGTYEYNCDCSFERAEKAYVTLTEDDKKSILTEYGSINIHCDFCNKDYKFT